MTSPSSVLGILRLARPQFRYVHPTSDPMFVQYTRHYVETYNLLYLLFIVCLFACRCEDDKVAYALHAYIMAQNYKLVAVGPQADVPSEVFASDMPEINVSGTIPLVDEGVYAFGYQDTEHRRPALHIKGVVVPANQVQGNAVLVHWSAIEGNSGANAQPVLELMTAEYTTKDRAEVPQAVKNMEQLVKTLDSAFGHVLGIGVGIGAAKSNILPLNAPPGSSSRSSGEEGPRERGVDQGRGAQPSQGSWPLEERPLPPGILPSTVGYDDVVPPGFRPPGMVGGGIPEGPPHPGGGMLVGPDHPMFGPGRLQAPPSTDGRGGVLPPGARWDPIGPPGTRGFFPEGGRRSDGEHPHPDIAQPGPGRGTDWTSFYG